MSDLHFGAQNGLDEPTLEKGLAELIARVEPSLLVVSGDLTHKGHGSEHRAAAEFLRALDLPLLVVPGNHDIPTFPPGRLTHPFQEFTRQWETTLPVFSSPEFQVVGLCSVRPWLYQGGGVSDAQLAFAETRLGEAAPGAFKVVVFHHPMPGAPWRSTKLPLSRRTHVLDRLANSGAELILSGHVHQGSVSARNEFEVVPGDPHTCVLATSPGLGRPRAHRRHEARGALIHSATADAIRVETAIWRGDSWAAPAVRVFPRTPLSAATPKP